VVTTVFWVVTRLLLGCFKQLLGSCGCYMVSYVSIHFHLMDFSKFVSKDFKLLTCSTSSEMSHNIDFKTIKQKILKFTWELTNSMKQKKKMVL